jgi:hypothetical protein
LQNSSDLRGSGIGHEALADGLAQTGESLDRTGQGAGHLVIFDRSAWPWEEKIDQREETCQGRTMTLWGM